MAERGGDGARIPSKRLVNETVDGTVELQRVSAGREDTESRGETFYPGPSCSHLAAYPPKERWDDWVELSSRMRATWVGFALGPA